MQFLLVTTLVLAGTTGDGLFADGFETSPGVFLGPPVVIDWGAAPAGCTDLYTVDIRNDTNIDRAVSLARSALPIAYGLSLTGADELMFAGPGNRRVPAQFSVAARWSAGPAESAARVRWVTATVLANVPAQSMARYVLRHCPGLAPLDLGVDQVAVNGMMGMPSTVDTVAARFTVADADRGMPLMNVTTDDWSVDIGGGALLEAAGQPQMLAQSAPVEWLETGPVRAVARQQGHFPFTICGAQPGYDIQYIFALGSSDVDIVVDFVNECGAGTSAGTLGVSPVDGSPWWDDFLPDATFSIDIVAASGAPHTPEATTDGLLTFTDPDAVRVAQLRGMDSVPMTDTEWRRAVAEQGPALATVVDSDTFWTAPSAAIRGASWLLGGTIGWMRYREPQAVRVEANRMSLVLIDDMSVGEAQGIWNRARLAFRPGSQGLANVTQQALAEVERPLLLHAEVNALNAAGVFGLLPSDAADPRWQDYLGLLETVHDDTVRSGGQWDRQKSYSLTAWPDVVSAGLFESGSNASLDDFFPGTNIWSPTNTELLAWYATGDPRWVWDFALPQEWTQLKTNYYNTGSRGTVGSRNGFVVTDSSVGPDGLRYRSGFGSDDKTYNQGTGKAYLVYPDVSVRDRLAAAGDTYISRYTDALPRDQGLAARLIRRGPMQHLNMLRYAAEFAPTADDRFVNKLDGVMTELATDNLFAGVPCQDDDGGTNQDDCAISPAGFFHHAALWQEMLWQLNGIFFDRPWASAVDDTLLGTAELVESHIIPRAMSGAAVFDPNQWGNSFECDFSASMDPTQDCIAYTCTGLLSPGAGQNCFDVGRDPFYSNAFLPTLATSFMGQSLRSLDGIAPCQRLAADLSTLMAQPDFRSYFERGAGWFKDVNQLSQLSLYAIAYARRCEGQSPP